MHTHYTTAGTNSSRGTKKVHLSSLDLFAHSESRKNSVLALSKWRGKQFLVYLLFVLALLLSQSGTAQVCSTPGIDGPTTSTPPINTYYPPSGNITLQVGATSVALDAVPIVDPFGNSYGIQHIMPGDMLLIIQIQGASINSSNNNSYGSGTSNSGPDGLGATGYSNLNNVGVYEYLVATNLVPISGGTLQFRGAGTGNGLVNSYSNQDATSTQGQRRFQVVRVPQFSTLSLTSDLSCPAWNGRVGGIIALDAAGAIHMNGYTINASGKGFRAGYQDRESSGGNTSTIRTTNIAVASGKGEGIAGTPRWMFDGQNQVDQGASWLGYPQGDYGRGAPGNAGGGGNDHNAGGGGGSNGGAGGVGGNGWAGAGGANPPHGGRPGINVPQTLERIFLGGGGGGGDANNAITGVKGGPGGGAIFITADLITGTGFLLANGDNGQVGAYGSAPDGAGGGGAGGSIIVKTNSPSPGANLTLRANGGNGGNTLNDGGGSGGHTSHGPGGGGGGGSVLYALSGASVNSQILAGVNGRTNGGNGIAYGAASGQNGISNSFSINNLPPHLQGFSAACIPELVVQKTHLGINPVAGGSTTTYRITIENLGGGAAGGTRLTDQLPIGFTYQSATVSYTGGASGPSTLNNTGTTTNPVLGNFNIPLNGIVTINMLVNIHASVLTGTYHNGAQAHFLDPTRDASDPNRYITPSLFALPGDNTTFQSSGLPVHGSNYNGQPNGPTNEDVIIHAHINAFDDDNLGNPVNGTSGGTAIENILNNDLFLNGLATLSNVVITVVSPSPQPGVSLNTSTGRVTVAPLTPGGIYTIAYRICEIGNPANCDEALITVEVLPTANVSILKTATSPSVIAGENITYNITVSNQGPSAAANVVVTDNLPAGLTLLSTNPSEGTWMTPAWSIDTLKVGATATLQIVARTSAALSVQNPLINTAIITTTTDDPDPGNNTSSTSTNVLASADLSVTKTAATVPFIAGQQVTYNISITNNGPSNSRMVKLTDVLPTELTFVSANASSGTWTSPEWSLDSIPLNATATLSIQAILNSGTLQGSVITNQATVTALTPDPLLTNNQAEHSTSVNAVADIAIVKQMISADAIAGDTIVYGLTVSNAGPSAAQNVTISDIVPASIANEQFSIDGGNVWQTWNDSYAIGQLSVGSLFNLRIRGILDAAITEGSTLSNTATVQSSTTDPNNSNNTSTSTVLVKTLSDLSIEKTGPETIVAGTKITYGLTVRNLGPSNAANLQIIDALPADISNAQYSLNNGNSWQTWSGIRSLPVFASSPGINNILIRGDLSPAFTGNLVNNASVSSDTPDPNLANNTDQVSTLVSGSADLAITKSTTTSPVNKNQQVEYLISVFNIGPSDAFGVVINDTIVSEVLSAQSYSTDGGSNWLPWSGTLSIGNIDHNNTYTLRIRGIVSNDAISPMANTAAVTSTTFDPVLSNNRQTILTPLETEADLSIVKTGPASIVAGTQINYTLLITNNSPNMNAEEVIVTDNINGNLVADAEFSTNAGNNWQTWNGTYNIGNLAFGASYQILIRGNILSNANQNLINTAIVGSGTPDPTPSNNTSTVTTTILRVADIQVLKELVTAPENLTAGAEVIYRITYINNGPSDATNYIITDAVPSMIENVEASRCESGFIAWNGSANMGTVVSGGLCTVLIRGKISSSFNGSITNTATVNSEVNDPNMLNNTATVTNTVNSYADLSIVKTSLEQNITAGHNINYTITVSNNGPSDAFNVQVTDLVPSELQVLSTETLTGTWAAPTWTIGTLANNTTVSLNMVARTLSSTPQGTVISNTATVSSSTNDTIQTNNSSTRVTPVNAIADISVLKTSNADTIIAGQQVIYTIQLSNNGPSSAQNVSVNDQLPAGLSLVSAIPNIGTWVSPNWNVGTLAAGQTTSMQITAMTSPAYLNNQAVVNTAVATSTTTDDDLENNSSSNEVTIKASADLAISKTANKQTANAGEQVTYTITVNNNGPSHATEVVAQDILPQGLTLLNASTATGTWEAPLWNIGNLENGSQAQLTIVARVNTNVSHASTITNQVTVSSTTPDPQPANNNDSHALSVSALADIAINKVANKDTVIAGEEIIYTITVSNAGPSDAQSLTVTDMLPQGLSITNTSTITGTWSAPVWTIGTLQANSSAQLQITARVNASLNQGSIITNTAVISTPTPDPTPENNTSTTTTRVINSADLVVSKTAVPNPFVAGEQVVYTISISNQGPSVARNVNLNDVLPEQLQFVSASNINGTYLYPNWQLDTIAVGSSYSMTITALIGAGVSQNTAINNTVTATSTTPDPNTTNNTATHTSAVSTLADLVITKETDSQAIAGDTIVYRIKVRNEGPSAARVAQMADVVPASITNAEFSDDNEANWDDWTGLYTHGNLQPNQEFTIIIRGKILASLQAGTVINNKATALSATPDPNIVNNVDSAIVVSEVLADLYIDKTGPETILAGSQIIYGLTVRNLGPSNAANLVISDMVPEGISDAWYSLNNGNSWQPWSGIRTLPEFLATPGINNILIRGEIATDYLGALTNTATVSSDTPDPDEENNISSVTTQVQGSANLSITKTNLTTPVSVNQPIVYLLTVFNDGPGNAFNVMVYDTISSEHLSNQEYSLNNGSTWAPWTSAISAGTIANNGNYLLWIRGTVNTNAPNPLPNKATVTTETPDPDPTNNTTTIYTPFETEADISIVKTGPSTIFAGTQIEYNLLITNNSQSMDAIGLIVYDNIDESLLENPDYSIDGGTTWNSWNEYLDLGTLTAGNSRTVLIQGKVKSNVKQSIINTASAYSFTPDPDLTNNTSTIVTTVLTLADIWVEKELVTHPDHLKAGAMVVYRISYGNHGPSDATNVTITDLVPTMIENVEASRCESGFLPWNGSANMGTVVAGGECTVLIRGTIASNFEGSIRNTATITTEVEDPDPNNNISTTTDEVIVEADVVISKTSPQQTVLAGNNITYNITVTNLGPADAFEVKVSDQLPENLQLISAVPTSGTWASPIWQIGTLKPGESVSMALTAKVKANITQGTSISNTATVSSITFDPVTRNNTSTHTILVNTLADVSIIKTSRGSQAIAGENISYQITVTNNGPSDALSVSVSDTLPAYLSLQSAVPSVGTWIAPVWQVGTLEAGKTATMQLIARIDPLLPEGAVIRNTAFVTSPTPDPDPRNDRTTDTTTVRAHVNLSVIKTADKQLVYAGDTVSYQINVKNNGPSHANNIKVSDKLPNQLNFIEATGGGVYNNQMVEWLIPSLAVGANQIFEIKASVLPGTPKGSKIENIAVLVPEDGDTIWGDPEIITIDNHAKLTVSKKAATKTVIAGEQVSYTISIVNHGPSETGMISVTDTLPAGVTFVSASHNALLTGQIVTWQLSKLQVSDSIQLNLLVSTHANLPNGAKVLNSVVVKHTETDDPTPSNEEEIIVVKKADIKISKTASSASALPGQTITYQIKVSNNGPSNSSKLSVSDLLPPQLQFIWASHNGIYANGTVNWVLDSLEAKQTITFELHAKLSEEVEEGQSIKNVAVITTFDPTPDPEITDTSIIISGGKAHIEIKKETNDKYVRTGHGIDYRIAVINRGSAPANNVLVSDTLSQHLHFVSASHNGTSNEGVVKWNLPLVNVGDTIRLELSTTTALNIPHGLMIDNFASAFISDTITVAHSDTVSTMILNNPQMAISKTTERDSVSVGDTVHYHLTVQNYGTGTAYDLMVYDMLPVQLSFHSATDGGIMNAGNVEWKIDSLLVNHSKTLTVATIVNQHAQPLTRVANYAMLKTANGDTTEIDDPTEVVVTPAELIANDDFGAEINTFSGGVAVVNVLGNDTYNKLPVTLAEVTITLIEPAAHSGIVLNTQTGQVTVDALTPAGSYQLSYQICLTNAPETCDQAIVFINVTLPELIANDDFGTIDTYAGGVAIENILENDWYYNTGATINNVEITIISPTTFVAAPGNFILINNNPEHVTLNTETGQVHVARFAPPGTYKITYRICDKAYPENCDDAIITVQVTNDCEMIIPDGFSPNGDGINDLFRITCIDMYPNARIEIYNRWGNMVYSQQQYGNIDVHGSVDAWWDGRSTNRLTIGNDKLPAATYFYVLILDDLLKPVAGSVFLNR